MSHREHDPILGFRFVLELGYLQIAGFTECTGLSMETKVFEYREGGRNGSPLKFPEVGAVGNITLKKGVVPGAHSTVLFKWAADVMQGDFDADNNPNQRKTSADEDIDKRCAIVLQDETGQEVRRWKLFRAFPVKWTGPELKASASELALESLDLACEGLELAE